MKKKKQYLPNKNLQVSRGNALRNRIVQYINDNPDVQIIVSTSGGKDSGALLCWAARKFGADKIKAVHAILDTDWVETIPTVKAQCEHLGVELAMVKRDDGRGMLDLLLAGQKDRKTGEMKQKKWPGTST